MANNYRFKNTKYDDRTPGVHPTQGGKFVVRVMAPGFTSNNNRTAIRTLVQVSSQEEAEKIYAQHCEK